MIRCDEPEEHARAAVFGSFTAPLEQPGVCEYGQRHSVIPADESGSA